MRLIKALIRMVRKPKRHYPAVFSGHQRICNCGFSSAWDPTLRDHFRQVGEVG